MDVLNKVELRASTITLREDGIMHFEIKTVDEFTLDDVQAILSIVGEMGEGKAFPNLVTFENYQEISKEAKVLSASEEGNRYTLADAFVLNSVPMKLIGNFYLRLNKPVRPTRLFTDTASAIQWLHSFLNH